MRKLIKEQIENYILLLEEAHGEIRRAVEEVQAAEVLEILTECQNVAVQIGTMIEESEGEGFTTVGLLEEYCEAVYELHKAITEDACTELSELCKRLEDVLVRVKRSVEADIGIHREVVFLPYKASMWDSLESVWRKADADPDCDAYVIPIPYYDRKADGTFGELHYEGDMYPEDVPVVNYNDYSFEARRPDVVFIHNPYDEHNTVTSVHPFFYAKNLKKYTDRLVYIPYFVLNEIDPANRAAVEGIEHFVMVSGVLHADTVIVQSENMRLAYINIMTRAAGENTRPIWEKKILGLGSPKFDKIRNTERADLKIPEAWQPVLQKPDGSRKKVILYNTSVSALLEHGEEMLAKMQRVFQIFKENQEDVALLWRPHPLLKATIASMRPKLWDAYEKLVDEYCREGWGIYDDTADLDRAIVLCDGYYGDGSSLVQLCKDAGKPVMIQDVEVR